MPAPTSERRLVDMEFKPDELPLAEATPLLVPEQESQLEGRRSTRFAVRLAVGALAAALGLYLVDSAMTFAVKAVTERNILDAAYFVVLLVLMSSLGYLAVQQTKALRKLKSAERARELAGLLAKLDSAGSGMRLLAALQDIYAGNPVILGKLGAVSTAVQPHHSDRDVIDLLNREVFVPMDREADQRIQKAAIRASLGVSSCPHPALDAVVVLVLAFLLIRDLMSIYGLRHSLRSLIRVLTHALFTASTTAVMSNVVEFAMKAAQDRLAAAVIGTAGEALVVARRMFALGALAKAEIRPLPTSE
jgi:putative membrane protein